MALTTTDPRCESVTVPVTFDLGGDDGASTVIMGAKTFTSGKDGYHGTAKLQLRNGAKYQVNVMLVRIVPKVEA